MDKLKIGVVGAGRGGSMMKYCKAATNATLVAVCDNWIEGLEQRKALLNDDSVSYYTNYSDFLKHDMDVVVLANYANEHAPFAIEAMEKGLHVISEVLPVQNMKEAVELVEAVERTGKKYAYIENTCYMAGPREMKRIYREGRLGEFEYGEGEYCHNCESIWSKITHGDPEHWRNNMYASFYCTHSIGPLIHITGLRPVSVTGFELPYNERMYNMGRRQGLAAVEMVTLENGAILKSLHGELYKHSIWFSIYGSKGRLETAREDAEHGDNMRIYINLDRESGVYNSPVNRDILNYIPCDEFSDIAKGFSHNGCDFYSMWNAVEYIRGNKEADSIDVYEALDMFLPGLFAWFSILDGGKPKDIPNLREPAQREQYREDVRCTDKKVAGNQLLPCYSKGNPTIEPHVYEGIQEKFRNMDKKI